MSGSMLARTGTEGPVAIFGYLTRGGNASTGNTIRILIQERRVEPVSGLDLCSESGVAPNYVLRRIRRLTGLTWEELRTIFVVSRKTLHNWDAGEGISQAHLHRLHQIAGIVERLDRGNPVYLRNLLLKDLSGENALSLLGQCRDEDVMNLIGGPGAKAFPRFAELPAIELRKRTPKGAPIEAYEDHPKAEIIQGRTLKGIKPPRLRKT